MTVLKVATCQFPVSADIEHNAGWMARQLREAACQGARVAHFPEGAPPGPRTGSATSAHRTTACT